MSTFDSLKARQRSERDRWNSNLGIRVHRALSWLQKAEQSENDPDASFIFYWVAFNAAYANEIRLANYHQDSQTTFNSFLEKLYALDEKKEFENLIWDEFSQCIRVLLTNKYIYKPFWEYTNGTIDADEWKHKFEQSNNAANRALGDGNTTQVLAIVLSRIYTLRNQLIHGGATWSSDMNREQIRDCHNFMNTLVPAVIEIMMDNPDELWGAPYYPVTH